MSAQLGFDWDTAIGEYATRQAAPTRVRFHNTTHETGEQLRRARATAARQDELVLRIFERARTPLSPSQVWQLGIDRGERWLLTSVRRSITNLSGGDEPPLRKTEDKRDGAHGRREHVWRIT